MTLDILKWNFSTHWRLSSVNPAPNSNPALPFTPKTERSIISEAMPEIIKANTSSVANSPIKGFPMPAPPKEIVNKVMYYTIGDVRVSTTILIIYTSMYFNPNSK